MRIYEKKEVVDLKANKINNCLQIITMGSKFKKQQQTF
jgi:hypothetical protein